MTANGFIRPDRPYGRDDINSRRNQEPGPGLNPDSCLLIPQKSIVALNFTKRGCRIDVGVSHDPAGLAAVGSTNVWL